jgi:hypothetical protein
MNLILRGVGGPSQGLAIRLPQAGGILGRDRSCDVVLADALASRQHIAIRPTAQGWVAVDLGSTNGSQLNGQPLAPQQGAALRHGALLQVGASLFEVLLEAAPVAVAPVSVAGAQVPHPSPPSALGPSPAPAPAERVRSAWGPLTWFGQMLIAAGGLLLIAGAFLPWLEVTVNPTVFGVSLGAKSIVVDGLSGYGIVTLIIGALALLVLVFDVVTRQRPATAAPGWIHLALVAMGVGFLAVGLYQLQASGQDLTGQLGDALGVDIGQLLQSPVFQEVLALLGQVIQPEMTLRAGVMITAAGLISLLLGGLLRILRR